MKSSFGSYRSPKTNAMLRRRSSGVALTLDHLGQQCAIFDGGQVHLRVVRHRTADLLVELQRLGDLLMRLYQAEPVQLPVYTGNPDDMAAFASDPAFQALHPAPLPLDYDEMGKSITFKAADGVEAKGLVENEQGGHHADETQRRCQEHRRPDAFFPRRAVYWSGVAGALQRGGMLHQARDHRVEAEVLHLFGHSEDGLMRGPAQFLRGRRVRRLHQLGGFQDQRPEPVQPPGDARHPCGVVRAALVPWAHEHELAAEAVGAPLFHLVIRRHHVAATL